MRTRHRRDEPEVKKTYRGMPIYNRTGRSNDYFIVSGSRVRWGTLAQIKSDIDLLKDFGALPEKKGW